MKSNLRSHVPPLARLSEYLHLAGTALAPGQIEASFSPDQDQALAAIINVLEHYRVQSCLNGNWADLVMDQELQQQVALVKEWLESAPRHGALGVPVHAPQLQQRIRSMQDLRRNPESVLPLEQIQCYWMLVNLFRVTRRSVLAAYD